MLISPRGIFTFAEAGMHCLAETRNRHPKIADCAQVQVRCGGRASGVSELYEYMLQATIKHLFHVLCRAPFLHCAEQSARPTCWRSSCRLSQHRSVESLAMLFPDFRGLVHSLAGG